MSRIDVKKTDTLRANVAMSAPAGMKRKKNGTIKIHGFSKSTGLLWGTILILVCLTIITFIQMDWGYSNLLDAARGSLNNFSVMVLHPGTDGLWTMEELLGDLMVTICLALCTTLFGAVIALFLALLAACNLTNKAVSNVVKIILTIARSIPTVIWVLVFVVAISLGAEACIVGMMFHTVAFLAKAFSEAFEEVDSGVLEAVRSTGAPWLSVVSHCVLREKINEVFSWIFIRFENNFVNTVVIAAICGSGGIGYQLYLAANMHFSLHAVGLITYMCLAVSVVLEIIATCLRKRYVVKR